MSQAICIEQRFILTRTKLKNFDQGFEYAGDINNKIANELIYVQQRFAQNKSSQFFPSYAL